MVRLLMKLLLLALFFPACGKVTNKAQDIKMACGAELESAEPAQVFIKFDNADRFNVNLQQLQFASLVGHPLGLQISSKGCVVVPSGLPGPFSVALPGSTLGAVVNTANLVPDRINHIPLIKVEDPGFVASCPNEEIFANDHTSRPFQVRDSSFLELFAIKLVAESSTQPGRVTVFEKPLGQRDLQDSIKLSQLVEAEYSLFLSVESVVPEIKSQTKLSCKLNILRNKPKFDLSAYEGTGPYTVRPDHALSIQSNDSSNQVLYCQNSLDDTAATCALTANCQNIQDFRPFSGKISDVPGRYRYIFLATDRAGNRSDPACLNLAVVKETEQLTVAWQEPVLNEKNAFLPLPQLQFKPKITLTPSPEISEADLANRLYCRLSFVADGRSTVKGEGATCNGGRCKGQRLDEYRACDRDFAFTLADAWTQPFILNSQLTLDVQLRLDGAGTTTQSIGFAINDSRWSTTRIAGPVQNNASNLSLLKLNENLLLMATSKQELLLVSSSGKLTPVALPTPPSGMTLQRILLDNSKGSIAVALVYGNAQKAFTTLFHTLSGSSLFSNADMPPIPADIVSCSGAVALHACESSDSKKFFLFNGMWLPDDSEGETGTTMKRVLFNPGGNAIVANEVGYRIFENDPTADLGFSLALEDSVTGRSSIDQIVPDADGSFWIYSTDGIQAHLTHSLKVAGSWKSLEFPALEVDSHLLAGTQPFVKDKDGNILLFGRQFDPTQNTWLAVPRLANFFAADELIPNRDVDGLLWYRNRHMLWSSEDSARFIPASVFGLVPFQAVASRANWGGTVFLAGRKSAPQQYELYKFVTKPVTAFSADHAAMPTDSFPELWINAQGKPETTDLLNASTVALDQGVWKISSRLAKGFTSSFAERYLPLKNDGLCQISGAGLRCRYSLDGEWKTIKVDNLSWLRFAGQLSDGRVVLWSAIPNSSQLLIFGENQDLVRNNAFAFTDAMIQDDIIYLATSLGIVGLSGDFSIVKDLLANLQEEFSKRRTSFSASATSSGYYLLQSAKGSPLICQTLFKDATTARSSSSVCFQESQVALQLDADFPLAQQPVDAFAIDWRLKLAVSSKQNTACLLDLCFGQTQGQTTWTRLWTKTELAAFFHVESMPTSHVQSLTVDPYGHVWAAVRNLGILRLD